MWQGSVRKWINSKISFDTTNDIDTFNNFFNFSILSKNTVYDRVFDYVYGDVNDVETAEIIDADEKAEVKSVEKSAEGHSQEVADVDIEEEEAHQVWGGSQVLRFFLGNNVWVCWS